ncbi:MAG TPA: hypothetical protein VIL30_13025, partial [Ramlibacter sp.]
YFDELGDKLEWIWGRAPVEDDPAPLRSTPARQGHAGVALISHPRDVDEALTNTAKYSNVPYAELGGASFMLAIDPGLGHKGIDWHQKQVEVATTILRYPERQLDKAAALATEQAAILSLRSPAFDLAEFAQQAALRYFGTLFGYSGADHVLLEEAAQTGYRALQYLIVGRHFVSEPGTLPAAQQALQRLARRTGALIDEYATLRRAPRISYQPQGPYPNAEWPAGVQPWAELDLGTLGDPVLRTLPDHAGALAGQDLCNLVGGLLVGTVGNVQTALCLMVQALITTPGGIDAVRDLDREQLKARVVELMTEHPPVPYLPRRTGKEPVAVQGGTIPAFTDSIVRLRGKRSPGCPWGEVEGGKAAHPCLGRDFIEPLITAVLQRVLALPNLEQPLDSLTGEVLAPERLWGMGCSRYRLRFRRDKVRVQQPLIVVMPVKSPVAENAERLRRVIRAAAPRIEYLLQSSGIVHMAWFEFMEHDTQLALRTVYDGDFDAYMLHFAQSTGELFDQLFESIEGAPPAPVAEHPYAFVETIRRYNRAPLAGYFYCAYPKEKVAEILRLRRAAP